MQGFTFAKEDTIFFYWQCLQWKTELSRYSELRSNTHRNNRAKLVRATDIMICRQECNPVLSLLANTISLLVRNLLSGQSVPSRAAQIKAKRLSYVDT